MTPRAREAQSLPFRFFSPTSVWNRRLRANEPLDPRSQVLAQALAVQVREEQAAGGGPGVNTVSYSVPIYTVPATQPTVMVRLVNRHRDPALQRAWDRVPLPANARPAAGTDRHLLLWQPSTERLWEFLGLSDASTGWQAFWGGAMRAVSAQPGVYGRGAWAGASPLWGASASSLSIAGGLITLEDLEHSAIDHALAIALPDVRAGIYAAPARRTDGSSPEPTALPEGAHLRLDPTLDLAALHLPRLTLMLAKAAQRYGILVRDRAAHVTLYAQDPTPTGTDPYAGTGGYFEGHSPSELLASFPWRYLEVLRMSLHRTAASDQPVAGSNA